MPIVNQSVPVCQELGAMLRVITGLVSDVKAGKGPAQVVEDAVPALVAALTGVGGLSSELANGAAVDNTVALAAVQLKQTLIPGVV